VDRKNQSWTDDRRVPWAPENAEEKTKKKHTQKRRALNRSSATIDKKKRGHARKHRETEISCPENRETENVMTGEEAA